MHSGFAERENIAFTLLSDKKVEIIGAFGMVNPKYPKGSSWYGIASPGIFAIGPKGVITHRFTTTDYTDRPEPMDVLAVLRKSGGS